ncbi:hypothetical protein ElyMa_004206000 [Elysia marginata]|uniref:Fibroblast growth factor n=1 Tax=Elysia marginata TaxID=1093978 RepID=A0AAV4GLZ5_9GAST|nr:hypothetical protein ElyMa_004206000 [Elysia marginata]
MVYVCCVLLNNSRESQVDFKKAKDKVKNCTGLAYTRKYQLISARSQRFLQMRPISGRGVAARGKTQKGQYTYFNMTSYSCLDDTHIVRIKGVQRQNSLCFTSRGVLIQREDDTMSVKCAFYERTVDGPGYESRIQLVSVFNPNFIVAFDSTGRRLPGGRYSGRCNHITKRETTRYKVDDWHDLKPIRVPQASGSTEFVRKQSTSRSSMERKRLSSRKLFGSREQPRRRKWTGRRRRRHRGKKRRFNSKETRHHRVRHMRHKNRRRRKNSKIR